MGKFSWEARLCTALTPPTPPPLPPPCTAAALSPTPQFPLSGPLAFGRRFGSVAEGDALVLGTRDWIAGPLPWAWEVLAAAAPTRPLAGLESLSETELELGPDVDASELDDSSDASPSELW